MWIGVAGLAILGLASAGLARSLGEPGEGRSELLQGIALAGSLAIATPVAEALLLLVGGTDLLGARNLNTASGGFAVLIGGLR